MEGLKRETAFVDHMTVSSSEVFAKEMRRADSLFVTEMDAIRSNNTAAASFTDSIWNACASLIGLDSNVALDLGLVLVFVWVTSFSMVVH